VGDGYVLRGLQGIESKERTDVYFHASRAPVSRGSQTLRDAIDENFEILRAKVGDLNALGIGNASLNLNQVHRDANRRHIIILILRLCGE